MFAECLHHSSVKRMCDGGPKFIDLFYGSSKGIKHRFLSKTRKTENAEESSIMKEETI